ncbi:MAG: glycosyltransferase family 4 protein [Planctomycetota bacterium]|nr:glycosyltransferase family 4 protein [Planctomycetota bacterium]
MSYRILYHHRIRADDGQAVHVRELIGALRAAGHEVLECALVPKANGQEAHANGVSGSGGTSFWQRLRLPRVAVETMEVLYNRQGRAMVRAAAREFRPDFIYERHALHCRVGLDVSRELEVPLLLEVNSPMVDEMRTLGLLRMPGRAAATEFDVLQGADRVLAVTRVLGDILVERGAREESVRIVPNGAVPARYSSEVHGHRREIREKMGIPEDAFALGFIGYMRPWHRLDLVLELMTRPAFAAMHLVLIGRGPALEGLLETASNQGLDGRVHSLGELAPDVLPQHVCAFDGALIPAINAYASPLKLFDSLAASVPTLAPDQPNLREVVTDGETGLLFDTGNIDDLAEKLGALVADPAVGRRLGQAGRQSLLDNGWTWEGNAMRVADYARELGAKESA